MTTSPFEREILTHHFTSAAPFPRHTELYEVIVNRFVAAGLLKWNAMTGIPEPEPIPLRMYMQALGAVPLPVKRWVMPE